MIEQRPVDGQSLFVPASVCRISVAAHLDAFGNNRHISGPSVRENQEKYKNAVPLHVFGDFFSNLTSSWKSLKSCFPCLLFACLGLLLMLYFM